jgi:hypothetical protein
MKGKNMTTQPQPEHDDLIEEALAAALPEADHFACLATIKEFNDRLDPGISYRDAASAYQHEADARKQAGEPDWPVWVAWAGDLDTCATLMELRQQGT